MLTFLFHLMAIIIGVQAGMWDFVGQYAPQLWLDRNETYFPCSIDYLANYTHLTTNGTQIFATTNQPITNPDQTFPWFRGEYSAPVYAMILPGINETDPVYAINHPETSVIEVWYFLLFSYNLGKELFGTLWGNHVGDVEQVYIRFIKRQPTIVRVSWHEWSVEKNWTKINKTLTHPIVYVARGSHGTWFTSGKHQYVKWVPLYDYTSAGYPWSAWKNLQIITPNDWNSSIYWQWKTNWLTNVTNLGNKNTFDSKNNCVWKYCRFDDGPPSLLGHLGQNLVELKNRGVVCSNGCLWNSGRF